MEGIDQEKLQRAKKQIAEEKGWYTHLFIYLVINICLQLFYFGLFDDGRITSHMPWWVHFTTPFFWGIGLLGHWFKVFKKVGSIKFYKDWEARKIKQFMEEEEEDFSHVIKRRGSKK